MFGLFSPFVRRKKGVGLVIESEGNSPAYAVAREKKTIERRPVWQTLRTFMNNGFLFGMKDFLIWVCAYISCFVFCSWRTQNDGNAVNGGMEGDKAVLVPRGNGGGKKGCLIVAEREGGHPLLLVS